MKRFYAHLSANGSAASALTAAKRDMLNEERDNIDEAILLLSRLASQGPASRPPTQVARVRAEPKQAWPSARSERSVRRRAQSAIRTDEEILGRPRQAQAHLTARTNATSGRKSFEIRWMC